MGRKEWEFLVSKPPNPKHQAPRSKLQRSFKHQIPSCYRTPDLFGAWSLVFLWSLDLGAWCFGLLYDHELFGALLKAGNGKVRMRWTFSQLSEVSGERGAPS